MEKNCVICGNSFTTKSKKALYCSNKCISKAEYLKYKDKKKEWKQRNKTKINLARREKRKTSGKLERDRDAYTYFQKTGKTMNDYHHEYYLNNKDRLKQVTNKWNEKNKVYMDKKKKEWYEKNRAHLERYHWINNDKKRFSGLKQIALERDNWECQDCGMNNEQHIVVYGVGLHLHHLDSNPKNNILENLKTLCLKCHRKTFDSTKCGRRGKTGE